MSLKILVCDDEPHIVHVVASKLRNAGFEVLSASNGREGLDLALDQLPDLIFTDYQMPLLSGLELCAKLRADERTRHIPVVILSARGFSLDDAVNSLENVRKVMPKPFSPREILEIAQQMTGVMVNQVKATSSN